MTRPPTGARISDSVALALRQSKPATEIGDVLFNFGNQPIEASILDFAASWRDCSSAIVAASWRANVKLAFGRCNLRFERADLFVERRTVERDQQVTGFNLLVLRDVDLANNTTAADARPV